MKHKVTKQRRRRRVKKTHSRSLWSALKPTAGVLAGIAVFALFSFQDELSGRDPLLSRPTASLNDQLLDLSPNKWVKIRVPFGGSWRRQRHAGIAFDTYRNKFFIFGSDTHGENWDNSVREFDPTILQWSEHYPPARRRTYHADEQGHPVADGEHVQPWAMHVYDNLVYDPTLDALLVMSKPEHNPAQKTVPGVKQNPTWIYELASRRWRSLDNPDGEQPFGFGGASAYDERRDVVVTYSSNGVWELGPDRMHWQRATSESHHQKHQNLVYDSKHAKLAVFGNNPKTNKVWVYTPGPAAGDKGLWKEMTPSGDKCPEDQHIPVAFDSDNGVFLLVPDNPPPKGEKKSVSSSTFIYDLNTNIYIKLPDGDMPPLGMNYMMVYDPSNKVFFLVTGDSRKRPTVWALHLELFPFEYKLQTTPGT